MIANLVYALCIDPVLKYKYDEPTHLWVDSQKEILVARQVKNPR